jgi:hypothetical protein
MNLGISEITIIIIQVVLFVGVPLAIIWVGVVILRRIKSLEARIEELEGKRNDGMKE